MRRATIALALALSPGVEGCDVGSAASRSQPERAAAAGQPELAGTEMPAAEEAAAFTLTDTRGRPYDFLAETDGTVAMLFFGFTNCPDVCPIHMANLAAVLRELPTRIKRSVTVVFVTVDPDRDTPERVREWLDQFDRDFVGLIGDSEEVRRIQLGLGMPATVVQRDDGGAVSDVGHAAHVMVFSVDRQQRWAYPFGTRQSDWKRDIPRIVGDAVPLDSTARGS